MTLLLIYQLVGEIGVHMLQWPVPGPVLGMVLLFLTLLLRKGIPASID
ncbi:CidA/LrgA family protein, partial [Thiolapillus sp.]